MTRTAKGEPHAIHNQSGSSHLSPFQIAKLMRSVGFVEPQAPQGTTPGWDPHSWRGDAVVMTGVAIVLAESGGDPNRVHVNSDGSVDYGLWQINSAAHADLLSRYNWRDPRQNTEMAKEVWKAAGGFTPWVTYKNDAYRQYMGAGKKGLNAAVNDYETQQSPQVQVGGLVSNLAPDWLKELMDGALLKRAGLIFLGVMVVIIGVILMLESSKLARGITETIAAPEAVAASKA